MCDTTPRTAPFTRALYKLCAAACDAGNVVEVILSLTALSKGLNDVVSASLLGSILSNLLLVLGGWAPSAHHATPRTHAWLARAWPGHTSTNGGARWASPPCHAAHVHASCSMDVRGNSWGPCWLRSHAHMRRCAPTAIAPVHVAHHCQPRSDGMPRCAHGTLTFGSAGATSPSTLTHCKR